MSNLDYTVMTIMALIFFGCIVALAFQDNEELARRCAETTNHTYERCLHEVMQ